MPWQPPIIDICCGCVTDLKTAAAIKAALGIVTSPAVSWSVVRHSYVIRVSCFVTTSETRPDIIDVNLNNILSFGFGANAGLGPSCIGPKHHNETRTFLRTIDPGSSEFVNTVKGFGWIVLIADIGFLVASIYFLIKIFKGPDTKAAKVFMATAAVSIFLSFVYGMLFVSACMSIGGSFPIFEFLFCLIDVFLWIYFLMVVHSYRRKPLPS